MSTNPDESTDGAPTPDMLNQVFDRMMAARAAEREARDHAEQWPGIVNEAVVALSAKVDALAAQVATLVAAKG